MSALEGCTCLTALNGVACSGLVSGQLDNLSVAGKEEGFALSFVCYLKRNSLSLVTLDMRSRLGHHFRCLT